LSAATCTGPVELARLCRRAGRGHESEGARLGLAGAVLGPSHTLATRPAPLSRHSTQFDSIRLDSTRRPPGGDLDSRRLAKSGRTGRAIARKMQWLVPDTLARLSARSQPAHSANDCGLRRRTKSNSNPADEDSGRVCSGAACARPPEQAARRRRRLAEPAAVAGSSSFFQRSCTPSAA
jgi:hypothetical protein